MGAALKIVAPLLFWHRPSFLRRAAIALLAMGLLLASGCSHPGDGWESVRATDVLRVGMDASFPPFEALAPDGSLTGFDVDLARELGRRLGVEVRFVPNLSYDGLYDALAADQVDVLISALAVNPTRTADFAYSDAYFDAGQVLVVPERGAAITKMDDLAGRVVAVEFGSRGDLAVRELGGQVGDITLLRCETSADAVGAVLAGNADAAVVDHVTALAWVGRNPELTILDGVLASEPYAVVAADADGALIEVINRALAGLRGDGTLDQLVQEWLISP